MKLFTFLITFITISSILVGCNNPGNHNDFNIAIGNGEKAQQEPPTRDDAKSDISRPDEKTRAKDRWSRLGRVNKA